MRLELGGNNFGIISGILMVCYLAKPKEVMVATKCSTVKHSGLQGLWAIEHVFRAKGGRCILVDF